MPDRTVLIDFENIPKIVPAQIPPDVCVLAFFGASLKSVARDYHKFAMELGKQRCVEIDIHGHGKNALDFHIAFYLGEFDEDAVSGVRGPLQGQGLRSPGCASLSAQV